MGMVEAERADGAKTTIDRRYHLTSLPLGVENQLHWVLDVQMDGDKSRVRTGHAAENHLTTDRTGKRGIRAEQLNAGWNHPYLLKLLAL